MSVEMAADKVGLALYELGDCYSEDMTDEQVDILHQMAQLNRQLWALINESDCAECGYPIDPNNEVRSAGSECICDLKELGA